MRTLLLSTAVLAMISAPGFTATSPAAPLISVSNPEAAPLSLPSPKAGRTRPLVVVVAENVGAETTGVTIPYGVLKDSGVADVRSLSTAAGPVQLRMALKILADSTIDQFDATEPVGADIVIVPAQMAPKDPVLAA